MSLRSEFQPSFQEEYFIGHGSGDYGPSGELFLAYQEGFLPDDFHWKGLQIKAILARGEKVYSTQFRVESRGQGLTFDLEKPPIAVGWREGGSAFLVNALNDSLRQTAVPVITQMVDLGTLVGKPTLNLFIDEMLLETTDEQLAAQGLRRETGSGGSSLSLFSTNSYERFNILSCQIDSLKNLITFSSSEWRRSVKVHADCIGKSLITFGQEILATERRFIQQQAGRFFTRLIEFQNTIFRNN